MDTLNIIQKHTTTGKAKASKDREVRFMLVLDLATRQQLEDLCIKIGAKQIRFASELFTAALQEAIQASSK